MTRLLALTALSLLAAAPDADATRWRVTARILEPLDPAAGTTSPLDAAQVRVSARRSDPSLCPQLGLGPAQPCPWNGANWSGDTTDASGRFTSNSAPFLPPTHGHARDFKVEVHTALHGWVTARVIPNRAGPTGAPAWHFVDLGAIVVDLYAPPPIDLTPVEDDDGDDGDGTNPPPGTPPAPGVIAGADPCFAPAVAGRPDFAVAAGSAGAGANVSPDGRLKVQMRNVGGAPHARRLRFTMSVRNDGARDYAAADPCVAVVRVYRNAGPGQYQNAVAETDADLIAIPDGFSRTLQWNVTIRGTGDDRPGDWDEAYEYVRFEVEIDADATIPEQDESNNRLGPYCYHAPTNTFVTAGCGPLDGDSTSPATTPPKKKGPKAGDERGGKPRDRARRPPKRNG